MVDDAWGNHIHVEVCHHIRTYYHGTILLVEGAHHDCQGILILVYIVAVQLYGKLAALRVMYAYVPATADTQVVAFGDDVDEAFVALVFVDSFRSAIC